MIQRNGHYIRMTTVKLTSTALCLKCRGEVHAINYDGKSDPSMNWTFDKKCKGDWKESRNLLAKVISDAEAELKTLRTWIAYDRTPLKKRAELFAEIENTQRTSEPEKKE